jgi:phage portal protein BeeE
MIGFLTFSLRPWLTRIEQSVSKNLLGPQRGRYFAEFAIEGLLRADSAGRAAYLSVMTQNGLMTRDEGRAYDNRTPMGGNGAVLTVQSNLVPIDKLGANAAATNAQDALKAFLGITDKEST